VFLLLNDQQSLLDLGELMDKTKEMYEMVPHPIKIGRSGVYYLSRPDSGPPLITEGDVMDSSYAGNLKFWKASIGGTHPGPPYSEGGNWLKVEFNAPFSASGAKRLESYDFTSPRLGYFFNASDWRGRAYYSGSFKPLTFGFDNLGESERLLFDPLRPNVPVTGGDLSSVGNRAYARLRPKVERAGIAQALYELKDAPGMLKTTAKGFHDLYRSLGGSDAVGIGALGRANRAFGNAKHVMGPKVVSEHFLNHAFGWVPFIQDVVKVCDVAVNFDTYVEKTKATNGQWVKRRFTEADQVSESVVFSTSGADTMCIPSLGDTIIANGSMRITRETMIHQWYTGSFMRYLPEFDDSVSMQPSFRTARQMLDLFGANISPTTLYRVMPWTWLVDWYVGGADYVQRVEDMVSDSVVSDHFFLMRYAYERFRYKAFFADHQGNSASPEWFRSVEVKRRQKSVDPFNFSTPPGGLSPTQLAILGALGLSHRAP